MISQYPVRNIDLGALRHNVRAIRESLPAGVQIMAVVKADAYGHGIIQVAKNALRSGASYLAVARTDEGIVLRRAGVTAPILVLGASTEWELRDGVKHQLILTVCTPKSVRLMERFAAERNVQAAMHLKLDTGMGRIGARTEDEVREILSALAECPHVAMTGVFTHFADADGDTDDYTRMQLERFHTLTALLPEDVVRYSANSAAIHRYREAATMGIVRAGISMYGVPPVKTDLDLRPVMDWRTAVTFVKTVQPGDCISYGCTFAAEQLMRVATVACGYGDGYHRIASGKAQVILHGTRCNVIGLICMDQMMVDVTAVPGVAVGDEVVLMGAQGNETITADELGAWCGTIGYEVLLAATDRVHVRWLNEHGD